MEKQESLDELRSQILEITKEIVRLAGRRKSLARKVGRVKGQRALPTEDDEVEDALMREVIAECDRVGLDRKSGLKILGVLLAESKRAQGLDDRPTPGTILAKALALQRQGIEVVRLDVGEPDFHPPRRVLNACSKALFSFKTHYTESRGIPELRSALRNYLWRKQGFKAEDGEVAVTTSGRFAVYAGLASVVGEGESALIIEPNWPAYREALQQLEARAVRVHTSLEDAFAPSLDEVHSAIRPNTKAIVLSYPNNPTGKVIPNRLFHELVGLADDLDLTVLSDEIYNEYSSAPVPSVLKDRPKKFIMTSSFSKTWAMTGFRVGYAVSSPEVISSIAKMTSLMVTSVPEFIQWGAIKALDSDSDVKRNVKTMQGRLKAACDALDSIKALEYSRPDGAMYVFPRIRSGQSGVDFAEELLQNRVSVTPGVAFGDYPDYFRISLGQTRSTILEGIRRMGKLLP